MTLWVNVHSTDKRSKMIFLRVVACEIGRKSYFVGTDQRTGSGGWWELWVICCKNSDPLEIWISLGSAFFASFLFRQLCRLWSSLQIFLRSRNNASSLKTSAMRKRYKAEARAARNSRKAFSSKSLSNWWSASACSTISCQQSAIPTINHLRGSLVRHAFASQKPSPGSCFACR